MISSGLAAESLLMGVVVVVRGAGSVMVMRGGAAGGNGGGGVSGVSLSLDDGSGAGVACEATLEVVFGLEVGMLDDELVKLNSDIIRFIFSFFSLISVCELLLRVSIFLSVNFI